MHLLTLKKPGLLTPSHSRGGGGGGRIPPRISAAERRKILKFGTYVGLVNTNGLTKLQYWKSKRFWIMLIYVNYMHVFLVFIITDKMRPFGAFNCFDIVVETFNIILNKKTAQFSFISYAFYCFVNFLCISLFLRLMYFIVFLYGIVWVLNITKYNSDFNCNESKYTFCTQIQKIVKFWADVRLHNVA